MFAGVFSVHIQHAIRARDINAPLPGTICAPSPTCTPTSPLARPQGIRPDPTLGDIYQYESSGRFDQNQAFVGFNTRLNPNISLNGSYVLSKTQNDTEGGPSFPANSYDLTGEYGRAGNDVRHRFNLSGSINVPWKITLNPFIVASSAQPFNIVTGIDSNLDRQLTERPSFAPDSANCDSPNIRCTAFGKFNLTPLPGEEIIPRNFGVAHGFLSVNMRVSRSWGFGVINRGNNAAAGGNPRAGRGGGGPGAGGSRVPVPTGGAGGGGGGQRGGGGGIPGLGPGGLGGGGSAEKRYNLTLSINFQNLLNTVNLAPPTGNLSSSFFGQSLGLNPGFGGFGGGGGGGGAGAGNRRISAQVRFNF